jgi:hypothetical protein
MEGVLLSDSTAEGSIAAELLTAAAAELDGEAEMIVPETSLLLLNLFPPLLNPALFNAELEAMSSVGVAGI